MSLYTVVTGNTIAAQDINQVINVLQEPSGSSEVGQYWLAGSSYAANALISQWIQSQSRTSTPVSVSIDESIQAPSNCGTPSVSNLKSSGFQLYAFGSGVFTSANVAGVYTIKF